MNTPAIIYSRISTSKQDNSTAIESLQAYAKAMKYDVLEVFEEVISGRSNAEERQEFIKLIQFIEDHQVKHLLIWELSRLGRSLSNLLFVIDMLTKKKINVFIYKDSISTLDANGNVNTMGKLMISILGTLAEIELETFKTRSKRGNRANVQRGGGGTGIIKAYGYENIDKRLVINDAEAIVVNKIFDLYLQGLGTVQISNYLNNNNIPTKFNTIFNKQIKTKAGLVKESKDFVWRDGTVYGILTNKIYIGQRKYKDEIFDAPVIIEKQKFELVQDTLEKKYNKKNVNRIYTNVLKDKLKCGYCDHTYFMHKRANGKDNAYKCITVRYREQCGNGGISIDKLNNALYMLLNSQISMKYNVNDEKILELNKEVENFTIELNNISNSLKFEHKKLNNLLDIRLEGKINPQDYTIKYDEIQSNIDRLDKQYILITKKLDNNNNLITKLKNMNFSDIVQDKDLFKKYVNEIINEIKIYKIQDMGILTDYYIVKGDIAFYFDLTSIYDTQHYFILSQRSNMMLLEIVGDNIDIDSHKFIGDVNHFAKMEISNIITI